MSFSGLLENLAVDADWEPPLFVYKEVNSVAAAYLDLCAEERVSAIGQHESLHPAGVPVSELPGSETQTMQ